MSKEKRQRYGFAVTRPRTVRSARTLTVLLAVLISLVSLIIFAIAFNQVGGPGLDKNLGVAAAQSVVTAAGILAGATVALVSFYLARFFESIDPFLVRVEPSVTRRFYNSPIPRKKRKSLR